MNDGSHVVAAVDLGSNSFHMLVASYTNGHLTVLDRLREMVRFASGLDERGRVADDASERALACLERFGQRLRDMHASNVRAVGTNTFRRAKDSQGFLARAARALGHPIEIISGREEARLIYLGAANTAPREAGLRLVVDIGGGSTELIVGEGLDTRQLLSLYMGCVSLSEEYFPDGKLSAKRMKRARLAARMELEPVSSGLRASGYEHVIGTSGTIRATASLLRAAGWANDGINREGLERLAQKLVGFGHIDRIRLPGLSPQRAPVYAGGLAVLLGVFEALDLSYMRQTDGALREGLLYDLIGRDTDEDARVRTVRSMQQRYHVDLEQAARTEALAMRLLEQAAEAWSLSQPLVEQMLRWAARLHEVGLAIAHAQYHKHGAYLLEHADLAGFSQQEQTLLARLVRAHRRKITTGIFEGVPKSWRRLLPRVATLLRLAALLNRSRSASHIPGFGLDVDGDRLLLRFPEDWLDEHPLTRADLEREADYLKAIGTRLRVS